MQESERKRMRGDVSGARKCREAVDTAGQERCNPAVRSGGRERRTLLRASENVRARVPPYKTTHLNTLNLAAELVPQQFGTNSH